MTMCSSPPDSCVDVAAEMYPDVGREFARLTKTKAASAERKENVILKKCCSACRKEIFLYRNERYAVIPCQTVDRRECKVLNEGEEGEQH